MSSIYLAERTDGSIQKKVAIKVMAGWQVSETSRELFNHEQTILSRLRHPNIITMHHGGVSEEGLFYMVMDYVANGIPFDQYVKQRDLSQTEVIRLCLTVARAISYAHANLVIHRDLKASNILIDDNGHVVVVDFGIASSDQQQTYSQAFSSLLYRTLNPEESFEDQQLQTYRLQPALLQGRHLG